MLSKPAVAFNHRVVIFADEIFKLFFINDKAGIFMKNSPKFVSSGPFDNKVVSTLAPYMRQTNSADQEPLRRMASMGLNELKRYRFTTF